jgi:hypothetical protein
MRIVVSAELFIEQRLFSDESGSDMPSAERFLFQFG